MNFEFSPKVQELQKRLSAFMEEHIYPNEAVWLAHCHGPDAVQSERRIDLRLLHNRYGEDMRTKFWTTVHEGRPAKGMPSWKEVFTDDQFESIFAFLLTVQAPVDPTN